MFPQNFYRRQSKDLNTLRCQERQMLKLADMIKTALNEVGCEELPSGCDDLSVDQGFIENNVSLDQPVSSSTSLFIDHTHKTFMFGLEWAGAYSQFYLSIVLYLKQNLSVV